MNVTVMQGNTEVMNRFLGLSEKLLEASLSQREHPDACRLLQAFLESTERLASKFLDTQAEIMTLPARIGLAAKGFIEPMPETQHKSAILPTESNSIRIDTLVQCEDSATARFVKEQISEITGFSMEELQDDSTLEDVGVDSLSRMRIYAEIAERWPKAAEMHGEFIRAERICDIAALLDSLESLTEKKKPVETSIDEGAPIKNAADKGNLDAAMEAFRGLLGQKLGRPPQSLEPGADFFDDLGLSALDLESLISESVMLRAGFALAGNHLMGLRTLDELQNFLQRMVNAREPDPRGTQRLVPHEVQRSLSMTSPSRLERCALVGSEHVALDQAKRLFSAQGLDIVTIAYCEEHWQVRESPPVPRTDVVGLAKALSDCFGAAHVDAILWLSPTEVPEDIPGLDIASRLHCETFFLFAQALAGMLDQPSRPSLLALLGFDADHPAQWALRGSLRSLLHEWRHLRIAISAVNVEGGLERADARAIIAALMQNAGHLDLTLRKDALFDVEPAACANADESDLDLDSRSVVLLFGGGVGAVSEVGLELVAKSRCRLVAFGTTEWDGQYPYPDAESEVALRKAILVGQGHEAWDEACGLEFRAALRRRQLWNTRRFAIDTGGDFDYQRVDVRDRSQVEAGLHRIKDVYGRIDGVIHGAGITEDAQVSRKSLESFRNVFRTKAHSAYHLYELLGREPLRFVLFFGSLVAHTGCPGQTDYCAANEVLNYIAERWSRQVDYRVVSMMWGVWVETGLASKFIVDAMKRRGVVGISNEDGRRLALQEITAGGRASRVIIASDSMLEAARMSA